MLTKKRLEGAEIDDSFGSLTALCESNDWRELVRKHNDPDDSYHLRLFYSVVIGSEVERDVVRINFSSPWMLAKLTTQTLSAQLPQVGVFSSMPMPPVIFGAHAPALCCICQLL
jgi:hypothetical protein